MVGLLVGLQSPGNGEPDHPVSQPHAPAGSLPSGRQVAAPTQVGVGPLRWALAERLLSPGGFPACLSGQRATAAGERPGQRGGAVTLPGPGR